MYKINSIELVGYKRLQLSQITHFKAQFNQKNQLIIGTNGSGKSSLFHELSPLPADSKQYDKGGSKTIEINYNNSYYVLKSDFTQKAFHSFVKDGTELNESGLVTVQKELCEHHFGINEAIHVLMTGKTSFTNMSVQDRRQWFTKLSNANYDYLIQVYLKLKDETRDITGALKLAKNKLVSEQAKKSKDEELEQIKKDVELLYKAVDYLSELRMPVQDDIDELLKQKDFVESDIKEIIDNVYNLRKSKSFNNLDDISVIDHKLSMLEGSLAVYKQRENSIFKDHQKVHQMAEKMEKTKIENTAKAHITIKNLLQDIKELKLKKTFKLIHEQPQNAIKTIKEIKSELENILVQMKPNPDKSIFNRNKLQDLLNKESILTDKRQKLYVSTLDLEAKLKHAKEHEERGIVTCPNCNHTFNRLFDTKKIESTSALVKQNYIELEKLDTSIKELLELKEEFKLYSNCLQSFKAIVNHTQILEELWNKVNEFKTIENKPLQVLNELTLYEQDLNTDILIHQKQNELDEIHKTAEALENSQYIDFTSINEALQKINDDMSELTKLKNQAFVEQEQLKAKKTLVNSFKKLQNELQELIEVHSTLTLGIKENTRRRVFNEFLRAIQSTLAFKEKLLQDSLHQNKIITALEQEIDSLAKKEKALKIGLKILSPTEGLIAKGLYGFMKVFIQNMNTIISKIWTYPLVIYPCQAEDDGNIDLNYKFPMMVSTDEGMRKDISEGSSSMIEVIDLAFRACALKALKMDHCPLFLDEFGKTMDHAHRNATTRLIESLMQEDSFTQMFLISHDISQYGALANCEICVLNELNVILPPNSIYNKHIQMH